MGEIGHCKTLRVSVLSFVGRSVLIFV